MYFDEYTINKYKDIDLTKVNGFTCNDIDKLCSDVMNKRTFKFKSNQYVHNMFDYWGIFLLFGIFAILIGRKLD